MRPWYGRDKRIRSDANADPVGIGFQAKLMNWLANHTGIVHTSKEVSVRSNGIFIRCSNNPSKVWLQRTVIDVSSWGEIGIRLVCRNEMPGSVIWFPNRDSEMLNCDIL